MTRWSSCGTRAGCCPPTASASRSSSGAASTPAPAPALAVSLVEALTLSDALVDRLRDRLSLDPLAGVGERLAALRAAVERCLDQVTEGAGPAAPEISPDTGDPAAEDAVRAPAPADRRSRRAGRPGRRRRAGPSASSKPRWPVRARPHRTAARHRDLVRDRERASPARRRPRSPGGAAAGARRRAAPTGSLGAPRLAVPDVSNLGPVPETRRRAGGVRRAGLDRVAAAFAHAEAAYGAARWPSATSCGACCAATAPWPPAACRDEDGRRRPSPGRRHTTSCGRRRATSPPRRPRWPATSRPCGARPHRHDPPTTGRRRPE